MASEQFQIFKKGSKTYFYSSLFFPKKVRDDVFKLYAFVRVADNYVDQVPQDKEGFLAFKQTYLQAIKGAEVDNGVIRGFVAVAKKYAFDPEWANAFLASMEQDLYKGNYTELDETYAYIYGSAEVIGLFMSKILGLPECSYPYAKQQGRAMQLINFIRDIAEDLELNRQYLPLDEHWQKLDASFAMQNPENFKRWLQNYIAIYDAVQQEAAKGYAYIPRRYLIPIKTASDLYNWTATKIRKNPLLVFKKKAKPPLAVIILTLLKNTLFLRKRSTCV
jgi:phytoene synthase